MTRGPDRTQDYLRHMLDAIDRINAYLVDMDLAAFLLDTRTQDAVIRNLEVIGEAARNVKVHDPAFAARHPEIPWALAYRMRNALSHGYADIDVPTVWNTARNDLPSVQGRLRVLLARMPLGRTTPDGSV